MLFPPVPPLRWAAGSGSIGPVPKEIPQTPPEPKPQPEFVDLVFDVPLDRAFTYRVDEGGSSKVGVRVMAPFGRRDTLGYVVATRADAPPGLSEGALKRVRRVVDQETIFGEEEIELARWMAKFYLCGVGEALAAMIPSGRREAAPPSLGGDEMDPGGQSVELSEEQRAALEAIAQGPAGTPLYLYGITGSGKTEVFLRAAERALDAGKSVIYLVPEISLTHQVIDVVASRFGGTVAALHSGMTPSERLTEWGRIRRGEAKVVVGPRSAVFAPLRDLGLVVIDEEHDGSYKSGNVPRYHARQVAMKRCARAGARLVMGSATPSVEAWKLMRDGMVTRLNLSRRLSGGAPPGIRIVDLSGTEGALSRELKEEIRATAAAGRQTILFLNRRGFSYFYRCPSCGYELTCRRCSVSLTYHKSRGRALCHYCGYSTQVPSACPGCGSLEAGFAGFGTELIEEETRRTFPDLRVARADADSTARKGSLKETLDRFRAGEIDVLLGTQMVAKGLNFSGVRLVGVVLADTGLHLPDFRAAERTFSLIVQVAGRAGRYFPDGRVIVQTFRPGESSVALACALDVEGFYGSELAQREALGFPPYSRLIRVVFRAKEVEKADRASRRLAEAIRPLLPAGADLLGPAECPVSVISGTSRRHLILRGESLGSIHGALTRALEVYHLEADRSVRMEIDVDPVSLL